MITKEMVGALRKSLNGVVYISVAEATDALTAAFAAMPGPAETEIVRHKKRGTTYDVIAKGRFQVDGDLDMEKVTVYRGQDGQVWVRPDYEFNDGRFEVISALTPAPDLAAENERLRAALEFVTLWAWREDPPNANRKLTDEERLSAIKYHPSIRPARAALEDHT